MYRWKSWCDSRQRLALYAAACLALGLLMGMQHWAYYFLYLEWQSVSTNRFVKAWDISFDSGYGTVASLATFMLPAMIWSSLAFGGTSVGREYGAGAMPFVLTRPQRRWRIVWDDWALGAAEICIILSMFCFGLAPFVAQISSIWLGFIGVMLPGVLAVGICLYGLTQFLTLLTGSGAKGVSFAVAVVLFYNFFPAALEQWWHVHWPSKILDLSLSMFSMFDSRWLPDLAQQWKIAALWSVVALIFPFFSQWLIERREI